MLQKRAVEVTMLRVVLSACCILVATPCHAQTAREMRDYCRDVVEARHAADNEITMKLSFETGTCWGAFSAFQSLSRIWFKDADGVALGLCLPPQSTRVQLVEIFSLYATEHPQTSHEDWALVAWRALHEAFPC